MALLLVNSTISYVEEANADKAIKALTSALAPKAKVMRGGQVRRRWVVPGRWWGGPAHRVEGWGGGA